MNQLTHEEIAGALRAEFDPSELEWRPTFTDFKAMQRGKQLWFPYVQARAIMNRLDQVVGPFGWDTHVERLPVPGKDGQMGFLCSLTIMLDEKQHITRTDGAEDTDVEPIKGGISQALKRVAVQFGIGRYLYDKEPLWLPYGEKPSEGRITHDAPQSPSTGAPAAPQGQAPRTAQSAPAQQPKPELSETGAATWQELAPGQAPPRWLTWEPSRNKRPGYTYAQMLNEAMRGDEKALGWFNWMIEKGHKYASEIAQPALALINAYHSANREDTWLDVKAELDRAIDGDDDGVPF